MKIAVTSPSFCKNEHLRAEILKHFPQCIFNDPGAKLAGNDLVNFIQDAEGLIVGLEKVDKNILAQCPRLKIVSKYGVGLDNIDIDECQKRNIRLGWSPGVNKLSVAEMALAFMILQSRNLFFSSLSLKNGVWDKRGGFNLSDKTVGIIGVGNVGKELIRLLAPFHCRILVNDIVEQTSYYAQHSVLSVSKEEIYRQADFVSLHVPLTPLTDGLIHKEVLGLMKKSAFLINTARGPIVREHDLKCALKGGVIAGAAIDVYEEEPPKDAELLQLPNLICTPHIGGNSYESVVAMGMSAIKHLREFSIHV